MTKAEFKKGVGRWFWILTGIWIVFWVLDVLILVPLYPDESIIDNIKAIYEDKTDLAFIYLLITAPVYIYLIFLLMKKIAKLIIRLISAIRRTS